MATILALLGLLLAPQNTTPIPTPTPPPMQNTAEALATEYAEYQATVQAITDGQTLTTDGEQIYSNGSAILPDFASPAMITTIGYIKFALDSNNARAVFGPFAPIVLHIRFFSVLIMGWMVYYFGQAVISAITKLILFIIKYIKEIVILLLALLALWAIWWIIEGLYDLWTQGQGITDWLQAIWNRIKFW